MGFPGGSDGKESACTAGDLGLIPGLGRFPGEGNGNPLQYSCLENPMDRGAWGGTANGVATVGHDLVTKPPPSSLNPEAQTAWTGARTWVGVCVCVYTCTPRGGKLRSRGGSASRTQDFPHRTGAVGVVSVAWALGSGDQKCPSNFFCSQITDRCPPAAFLGK